MNFADELNQYLTTNSIINGATTWLGITDYFSDASDKMVSLYNDESPSPIKCKGGASTEQPRALIQVRGSDADTGGYTEADTKMDEIAAALDLLDTETIDGTLYYNIMTISSKKSLGRDDNNRPLFEIKISAMAEV